jgi:hypothetical protein
MSNWTTRISPDHTRPFGVEEVHNVWFVPIGWPGKGPVISLLIPECELQYVVVAADNMPVTCINRPPNKNVKKWIRHACELATEGRTSLFLACDSAAEAERTAKIAAQLLPHHECAALERMYDADSRCRGNLS